MSTLHERLSARIDELESNAVAAGWAYVHASDDNTWTALLEFRATWDPASVLRGLAEDRDILRAHMQIKTGDDILCCYFCFDIDGDRQPWPCFDVRSLARRHAVPLEEV